MSERYKQIIIGNVCSLCEESLNWSASAKHDEIPVALNTTRAICMKCYKFLQNKYFTEAEGRKRGE